MDFRPVPYKQMYEDHEIWLNELEYHRHKIKKFRQKLSQILDVYVRLEIQEHQFDHQFQSLEQAIENLSEKIKQHQYSRSHLFSEQVIPVDDDYYGDHEDLRTELHTFRKMFLDTQKEYYDFLATQM